jgi:DNA-binding transcriptional MerR regulator
MMRMKQLSAAAGVPKGTIQFYIKEGLVPKPVKTYPNSAYYTENHLNAIRLIKELQAKRFLPLSVIKQMMQGGRGRLTVDEIKTLVEIDGKLFHNLKENPTLKPITARELSKCTGVSLKEIKAMERLRILTPIQKGKRKLYEEDDIRIVECWAKMRESGFSQELGFDVSIMEMHRDVMERLVEAEAKMLTSRVSGKVPATKVAKMVEEATAIVNSIMALMHKKLIIETTSKYTLEFLRKSIESE